MSYVTMSGILVHGLNDFGIGFRGLCDIVEVFIISSIPDGTRIPERLTPVTTLSFV